MKKNFDNNYITRKKDYCLDVLLFKAYRYPNHGKTVQGLIHH